MILSIQRLSYGLGAEISGVDVRAPVSESTYGDIHRALLDHSIVLFRDQPLTTEHHITFSSTFGEFDTFIRGEVAKYAKVVKAGGIRVD